MNTPQPWEFPIPQDVGLHDRLEAKKQEYWRRIETPNLESGWSSWGQCDLIRRHDTDENFRLLYYKFVIISNVLLASEKFEREKKAGDNNLPDSIEGRLIRIALATSLNRQIDTKAFETACEVIHDYLTNPESLN